MSVMFHPLPVKAIEADTPESLIVSFSVPDSLREAFGFTQGQYLTLRSTIAGKDLRRSYSICAGVDDGELRVAVRRVNGGAFSTWIHQHLKVGDTVQVMAPQGRFFVPIEPTSRRHHVGIAGGSGITPILSIMKTVLAREPHSQFTLIYSNRTPASTMFKEEIEDLRTATWRACRCTMCSPRSMSMRPCTPGAWTAASSPPSWARCSIRPASTTSMCAAPSR